jgi:hypothetical protein
MYGLAVGLFRRNLGLIGGLVSAGCYLIVSAAMATVGTLPARSQGPAGLALRCLRRHFFLLARLGHVAPAAG